MRAHSSSRVTSFVTMRVRWHKILRLTRQIVRSYSEYHPRVRHIYVEIYLLLQSSTPRRYELDRDGLHEGEVDKWIVSASCNPPYQLSQLYKTQSTHCHFHSCALKFQEPLGTRANFLWILMHLISVGSTTVPCSYLAMILALCSYSCQQSYQ
jgi:hypothetical protein